MPPDLHTHWHRARAFLLFTATAGALTACGGTTSTPEKRARTIASWQATMQLTREARARDAIPEVYARRMLRIAAEEIRRSR